MNNGEAHNNPCSTCGTVPARMCRECPRSFCSAHGGPDWVTRHLFGSRLIADPATMCGLCQSQRIWFAWRTFVVVIAGVGSVVAALEGHFAAPLVLVPVGGLWWWITEIQLKTIRAERQFVFRNNNKE